MGIFMRKWERPQVMRLVAGLSGGIVVGLILGLLFHNIGLFLPLGGIAGMCVAVVYKK